MTRSVFAVHFGFIPVWPVAYPTSTTEHSLRRVSVSYAQRHGHDLTERDSVTGFM